MRKCANCYNGHYSLSDIGEEIYCDESGFMEEEVDENSSCDYHRFIPGLEEEKNYLLYDETFIAPGYLIVNVEDGKLKKFIKIYDLGEIGLPKFGIRAYSKEFLENPKETFSKISFTFRDIEDYNNGLYDIFFDLYINLLDEAAFSIDPLNQGLNNLHLTSNSKVTKLIISKDNYKGLQHPSEYIDILLGDELSCKQYEAFLKFYQTLSCICTNNMSLKEFKATILS